MRSQIRKVGVPTIPPGVRSRVRRAGRELFDSVLWAYVAVTLFYKAPIHPSHGLGWRDLLVLAHRMRVNKHNVETGLTYRAHLAMAVKVLSEPRSREGVIVEAGCWKGGTTVNLSLIAKASGRSLIVYDSFEGLPTPAEGDRWASAMGIGAFKGELEEVRSNVERFGAIEVCEFRKGWFSDTMGSHTEPILLAFVDVDYQASLHDCILGLWPHLLDDGYVFIDEYLRLDYCAIFFSERYWRTYFDRPPPGLMGAGSGVGLGQVYPGTLQQATPLQEFSSVAWTRKNFYAEWDYDAGDHHLATPLAGGGPGSSTGPEGWALTTPSMADTDHAAIEALLAADPDARRRLEEMLAEREARGAEPDRTGD